MRVAEESTEKTTFLRRLRRVLGLDLHSWEQLMLLSLAVTGLAAIAVFVTTASVVILQRNENAKTKTEFEAYKIDSGKQIASANALAEVAKANVAKAQERSAELEKDAASLEADNLALQTSLRPRRLSFIGWSDNLERVNAITEGLKKFSGTTAFLQVVPDFEARMFAQDIATALASAGWIPEFVDESRSHISETSFPEGVSLFTLTDGKSQTEAGTAFWMALSEADVLMSGTGTFGSYIFHKILEKPEPGLPYFEPPVTAVFIRIGLKPFTSQFLEIQRRNMERQDREFDRNLRAAYERSGSMLFSVPDHPPIAVKPGSAGEWIAINPDEQSLLPKKVSPTLVLPGGVMIRSSPLPEAEKK